jgi:uncharacterized coiled-coil DUF342 family protein
MEIRQRASEVHQKYAELLRQVEALRQEMRRHEEEKQTQRQKELYKEALRKAQEKAQRGEKLTLQEFKLLAEEESEQNIKEP